MKLSKPQGGIYLNFAGIASEGPFCLSLLLSLFCLNPDWQSDFLLLLTGDGVGGKREKAYFTFG